MTCNILGGASYYRGCLPASLTSTPFRLPQVQFHGWYTGVRFSIRQVLSEGIICRGSTHAVCLHNTSRRARGSSAAREAGATGAEEGDYDISPSSLRAI